MSLLLALPLGGVCVLFIFFFQAEDGIRDLVRSRGLGDVYKRQPLYRAVALTEMNRLAVAVGEDLDLDVARLDDGPPVSYTHLTLPTIYSV